MQEKGCIDCKWFDIDYGCLCSEYDKWNECPMELSGATDRRFDDEYARWFLEEKRYEEDW
ncbi:MAG: hypothetical protein J5725_10305 [Bacteroidales bacterium]|nr:hypothetical protein [Bacteroidales bacterium]